MWQEFCYTSQIAVQLRREATTPKVSSCESFYKVFLHILSHPVFKNGEWIYININQQSSNDAWRLIAYRWQLGNENRLCVINYSDAQASGSVIASNAQTKNGNDTIPVTDLLTGTIYYRSASQMRTTGLFVIIQPWNAQIFTY